MKIALLIPDRGDRPLFLANALRMAAAQTLKPVHIEVVNDAPLSEAVDITWRYRIGYERLIKQGFDFIALWENDDWYHPDYLKIMAEKWVELNRPLIMGQTYTIYYHLKLRKWFTMNHTNRSSAMNTIIIPDLRLRWTEAPPVGIVDCDPYTDIWLWKSLMGNLFTPDRHICMGMKHGVGLCGGDNHTTSLHRYNDEPDKHYHGKDDGDLHFLRETLDAESFEFYSTIKID